MPRLFVAIDLPEEHRGALAALKNDALDARWTPHEQYHLTLRFLGNITGEEVGDVEQSLARIQERPFALRVEGVGVLPSLRRPRVLYAGLAHQPTLHTLQHHIKQALLAWGLDEDRRSFRPHVTLARLRQQRLQTIRTFLTGHRDLVLDPFMVTGFHLYESRLRPQGALHIRRRTFALL